jgi:hypothetical protein
VSVQQLVVAKAQGALAPVTSEIASSVTSTVLFAHAVQQPLKQRGERKNTKSEKKKKGEKNSSIPK